MNLILIAHLLFAYLLGSLSFAVIIPKWFGYADPRTMGSHNAGTTNVLRYTTKAIAFLVLLGDALKGTLALWVASGYITHALLGYIGLSVILGHIFPIFFKFQGGKGVATAWGVLLMLHPLLAGVLGLIWVLIAYISHYASLATLMTMSTAPILAFALQSPYKGAIALIACLILMKHRRNFSRLYHRQEMQWR